MYSLNPPLGLQVSTIWLERSVNVILWVCLVVPALLDGFSDTFCVFAAVVFVEVRGFDVGRRGGVRIVEETKKFSC